MQSQLSGAYLNTSKVRQLLYCFLNVSDRTSAAKRVIAYIFVEIRRIHSQNSTKTTSFFSIAYRCQRSSYIRLGLQYLYLADGICFCCFLHTRIITLCIFKIGTCRIQSSFRLPHIILINSRLNLEEYLPLAYPAAGCIGYGLQRSADPAH